jgi:uncharacterized protein YukE
VNENLSRLANRIRNELGELERVIGRVQEGWKRAQQSSDDFYLDSVALNCTISTEAWSACSN